MSNLSKMIGALTKAAGECAPFQAPERIELKRGKSGHYRVYVACMPGTPQDADAAVVSAMDGLGITVNAFRKAGRLVTLTLVDDSEDAQG